MLKLGDFVRVAPSWLRDLETNGVATSFKPFMYGLFTVSHIYGNPEGESCTILPFPADGRKEGFSFHFDKLVKDEFLTAVHRAKNQCESPTKAQMK